MVVYWQGGSEGQMENIFQQQNSTVVPSSPTAPCVQMLEVGTISPSAHK